MRLLKATEGNMGGVYCDPVYGEELVADGRHRWWSELIVALVDAGIAFDERGGFVPAFPDWAHIVAVRRIEMTSPSMLANLPAALGVAPFSTFLRAEPATYGSPIVPVGVDYDDPARWLDGPWYDQPTGQPLQLVVDAHARDLVRTARRSTPARIVVKTVADVATAWALLPDPTNRPVTSTDSVWERGRRAEKPIRSDPASTALAGKEGLILTGRLADPTARPEDLQTIYQAADTWPTALAVLRAYGTAHLPAVDAVADRTLRAVLNDGRAPSATTRAALVAAADTIATDTLAARGDVVPAQFLGRLGAYLAEHDTRTPRRCGRCGKPLTGRQRSWCGKRCERAANRARTPEDRQ